MSKTTEIAIKLLESLPETEQERVVEALRQLIQDSQDEAKWDRLFNRSEKLVFVARQVQKDVIDGKASDMDYEHL